MLFKKLSFWIQAKVKLLELKFLFNAYHFFMPHHVSYKLSLEFFDSKLTSSNKLTHEFWKETCFWDLASGRIRYCTKLNIGLDLVKYTNIKPFTPTNKFRTCGSKDLLSSLAEQNHQTPVETQFKRIISQTVIQLERACSLKWINF